MVDQSYRRAENNELHAWSVSHEGPGQPIRQKSHLRIPWTVCISRRWTTSECGRRPWMVRICWTSGSLGREVLASSISPAWSQATEYCKRRPTDLQMKRYSSDTVLLSDSLILHTELLLYLSTWRTAVILDYVWRWSQNFLLMFIVKSEVSIWGKRHLICLLNALGARNDKFEYISKWRLAAIFDFCITWSFQKTIVGQNR